MKIVKTPTPFIRTLLNLSVKFFLLAVLPLSLKTGRIENTGTTAPSAFSLKYTHTPPTTIPPDIDRLKQSDWYTSTMKNMEQNEYTFNKTESLNGWSTPNRKNNLRFYYDEHGFTVEPRTTALSKDDHSTLPNWKVAFQLDKKQVGQGSWQVNGNKAEYITENITVQYINNEDGMRQNFIVQKPLSDKKVLQLHFSVKTTLTQQFGSERLQFSDQQSGIVLSYEQLKVWDANGRPLEAAFEKNDHDYSIHVNTRDAQYPITIDPISTTPAAMVESDQADALMANSVACAGDVNGDGYSDIIVGAYGYDHGEVNEGVAFIYHGSPTGISTTAAAMVESNQAYVVLGISVAGAGDVNGDGFSDIIVGASEYDNGENLEGAVYIYHGSAAGINTTVATLIESNQAIAYMGFSVAGAGDVNGDGFSDVIVGAYAYDNGENNEGVAFVYHGSATGINPVAAAMVESNMASALMGNAVAGAGDVNGDGYADVIVASHYYSNPENHEGAVFVYHGSATGINTTAATRVESNQADASFGWSLSSAGDLNGDGYSDVIVGSSAYDNGQTNEGAAFIYYGSATGITPVAATMLECNQAAAQFGISVAGTGDLNGDGYNDLLVGAYYYQNGEPNEGAAFVYYGSVSGINTTAAVIIEGNQETAKMGNSVSAAGDVNGDGYQDIIVAANLYDNGQNNEGAAFVYHGSPATLPVDLISFKAAWLQKGSTATVNFITDNEMSICCYEIEKSKDGVNFKSIGKITAKNSSTRYTYSFIDKNAIGKKLYYRLKTIHNSRAIDYSSLWILQNNLVTDIQVFPNPATDVLQLQLTNSYGKMNVQVVNSAGQVVKQFRNLTATGQVIKIPVRNLANGTYFLYLQGDGKKQVLQFMKR